MQTIKKYLSGMAVCLAIAVPSWLLGKLVPVIGGPVFSIVIGMVIALFWTPGAACKPGVGFTSKKILQTAVVLLGFGIVAMKRDSSEEQQEIYRQEREEAIRLRQEAMAERKQEMQDAYDAMKRRRAARLAERGIAPTAAAAEAVDAVETVEAAETEAAEAEELAGDAIELAGEEGRLTEEAIEAGEDKKQEENS